MACSTTTQAGQLASAQITLPYSPFISKLPKHTKITLFSFDEARDLQPKLEFDGTIQGISWRKDKGNGNTALFLIAQTDGNIWSVRKKFNYYLDNAFGMDQMLSTAQDIESRGATAQNPIFDAVTRTIVAADGDGGKAATIFLTHVFNVKDNKFDGKINYVDCGYRITTDTAETTGSSANDINQDYYANYIKKFYLSYKTLNKVCRLPLPKLFMEAFQYKTSFGVIMNTLQSLQGEVNFWNFATHVCDQFAFEVFDIPDATCSLVSASDMLYINNRSNKSSEKNVLLAEYIIKPKSPFGPIPLCNIIFPNQVLDKSFYRNFQSEITRVNSAQMLFKQTASNTAGFNFNFFQGPHFKKSSDNDYFSAYDVSNNPLHPSPMSFLKRSVYEDEFGVTTRTIELPELASRMFATLGKYEPIQNMMNHEFLIAYTEKVQITLQATPDIEVVPGFSMLVLDENGEHILAYCIGREKAWDKNGNTFINLKMIYPRPYDLNTNSINDIADPFDPIEYSSTYKQDLNILGQYIGSTFIDPKVSIISYSISLMEEWINSGQNTQTIKDSRKAWRKYTNYLEYLAFYGIPDAKKYDVNNSYNIMPESLIRSWDISDKAASISALQYTYAEGGYKNPQSTDPKKPFKPSYDSLNVSGPIQVSVFITGIINCHNRYLMQIGNSIT